MARMIDADALKEIIENHVTAVSCCPTVDWSMGKTQFKKQCLEDIGNAPTVGGWISVKDRLPDKQGVYLVAFKPPLPKVTIAWWATKEVGWYDLEYNFHTDSVSHWMPLPPMPEQEVTGDV